MSMPTDIEYLDEGRPTGSIARGTHGQVIQGIASTATRQLTAKESGSLVIFDQAAGITYTLPTPVEGMNFRFLVTVSITSNAAKVITKTIASEFLIGGVAPTSLTAGTSDFFVANGTSHVSINLDSTTKAGLIGGWFDVKAISTTQWAIVGVPVGSGTLVDPFATT